MMGIFALQGERVYLNEMLLKSNHQACAFPMEHWLVPNRKQLFIPLSAGGVTALDLLRDAKFRPWEEVMTPELCGILVCSDTRIYEVGVVSGALALRRVPVVMDNAQLCLGVRYVRASHRDMEEAFTAALRITNNLEKSNELVRQTTLGLPGKPLYTTLPQLVWGAITQDVQIVRAKITRQQLSEHVRKTLPLLTKAAAKKSTSKFPTP